MFVKFILYRNIYNSLNVDNNIIAINELVQLYYL